MDGTHMDTAHHFGNVVARSGAKLFAVDNPAGVAIEPAANAVAPSEPEVAAHGADDVRVMSEWAIRFNGRHYVYGHQRYDHLSDAVAYACLRKKLQLPNEVDVQRLINEKLERPGAEDRRLMALHAISFRGGVYEFGGYRYDHLKDALNYARLKTKTTDVASAG